MKHSCYYQLFSQLLPCLDYCALRHSIYMQAMFRLLTSCQKKRLQEPTREVFEQELEKFVNSEQSLIARRIVEPSKDGTTHFTYATYGLRHYQKNSRS